MSKIGYARVSSTGQSLDVQLDKLKQCDKLFSEKKSATSTNGRTALKDCLNYLREGDQLIITRLDRLARSVLDLTQITHDLQQRNIDLVVIDQSIDTSTPTGKLMFTLLGAIVCWGRCRDRDRDRDRASATGQRSCCHRSGEAAMARVR